MPESQSNDAHRVVAYVYDRLWPFEFGVAAEVFGWARPELKVPWYDFAVAGEQTRPVQSFGGLSLTPIHDIGHLETADTIIIPGWRHVADSPSQAVIDALCRAHRRGARLLSYCTGTFVLAYAGLLNGRSATTHWRYMPMLEARFPEIEVVEDVLYVASPDIITSAGSSSAIDASLHMIRTDYGAEIANKVAKSMVMPPHRDGGQAQYIEAPVQERPGESISTILDWVRSRLHEAITITDMAERAAMSERTFLRRFRDGTGTTPLKWLRRERVFRAMRLLEASTLDLADVSLQSGFGSIEGFRKAFKAVAGTSPSAYRKRFSTRT